MSLKYLYCRDRIVSENQTGISPENPGFLFGEGLFETIRADKGTPFLLPEHLARLESGLKFLGFENPSDFTVIPQIVNELLELNHIQDSTATVKIICSPQTNNLQQTAAELIITAEKLDLDAISKRQQGIQAQLIPWHRDQNNPLLRLKSLNYLENRYALKKAKQQGYGEGIFFNQAGELCEGTFSNIFLIKNDTLLTPSLDSGILPGITRAFILEKARQNQIECREIKLNLTDLQTCDGAFITSSLMHIAPIIKFEQIKYDLSQTAELRAKLQRFFW